MLLHDAGNDVRARASVINNIADSIARIDDTITRSLYIAECATLTGAREQDIIETVNSTRNRMKLTKLKEIRNEKLEMRNEELGVRTDNSQTSELSNSQAPELSNSRAAESNLMKYVIRYGDKTIGDAVDGNGNTRPLTFVEYVSETMNNDELSFTQPLYTTILQELLANKDKPNFTALNFLLTHPDDEIRNYALSQATDNGSTIGVNDDSILDHLYENAEKLIADLALAVVSDKITELDHKIKSGTLTPEDIIESTITLSRYKEAQIQLRKSQ